MNMSDLEEAALDAVRNELAHINERRLELELDSYYNKEASDTEPENEELLFLSVRTEALHQMYVSMTHAARAYIGGIRP